jgi:polyhydroxybutyrate depolymerase
VDITSGEGSRDYWPGKNGCTSDSATYAATGLDCVDYNGCNEGYPVVWCTYTDPEEGHNYPRDTAPQTILDFFSQF